MVSAIYDSGSNISLINSKILHKIKSTLLHSRQLFRTISGVQETSSLVRLPVKIHKIEHELSCHVIKNDHFSYDLLLGLDAIKAFRLTQNEDLQILQQVGDKKELVSSNSQTPTFLNNFSEQDELNVKLGHLDINQQKQLRKLILKHSNVFATHRYDVGRVDNHEAQIKLIEKKYISKKPYRCSLADEREIERQISQLLNHGIIEESKSPFAAPVTLAYKKEEGRRSRLCIDFRELNKNLVPESQPFPRIEDIVVKARNCRWFTVLDINSAFWCIPIRMKDRPKTAFVTQSGHYQWTRLPFGLKISPAIFQRVLANALRRHNLSAFSINYIDDILIFSNTFSDHIEHIGQLLKALFAEGFPLKMSKCILAQPSVKYLGHVLSYNTISPHQDNVKSIQDFPTPTNRTNVRQFLGKINFYHKWIPDAVKKLEPLHRLLRDNVSFEWTEDCAATFRDVKQYLCQGPILSIFDPLKPTYLFTDASIIGVGAVLKQQQDDGELHPVAYFSKKLTPAQAKKKAIYLECIAIREALRYWQHWLLGITFTVVTDHRPLENLRIKARSDEELGDLVYYLSQYSFTLRYAPGKTNQEADALSRNPVLESFESTDEILKITNLVSMIDLKNDQHNSIDTLRPQASYQRGELLYKNVRGSPRILVSHEFAQSLISKVHQYYGHIGADHMAAKIRPFYYISNLGALIQDFCKKCDICARFKTRRSRQIGLLSQLGPAKAPFEIMSLDTIGGFSGYRSPKRYLHVLADHFTRFAFTYPARGQQAADLIRFLQPIFSKHPVQILLADRYSGINCYAFKNFLKRHNVTLVLTAVDCAFSNGLNERLNQTLVNRIRCKVAEFPSRPWSVLATECTVEYNRTRHSVTQFSPQYLLTGEHSSVIPSNLREPSNLAADRRRAFMNSQQNHMMNKKRIDQQKSDYVFQVGELVYVENGNRLNRNKLDPVRSGPFKILERISNTIYLVATGKRRGAADFVHSSKLLPAPGGEM